MKPERVRKITLTRKANKRVFFFIFFYKETKLKYKYAVQLNCDLISNRSNRNSIEQHICGEFMEN